MSYQKDKGESSSKDPPNNKSFEDTPYDGQTYHSQVYRNSHCGEMLKETIEEFVKEGKINQTVAQSLLLQFDESIQKQLKTQLNNTIRFVGHLHTYRSYNDVWTLLFKDILFTEGDDQVGAPVMKFVCQECPDKDKKKKSRKRKISSDNE